MVDADDCLSKLTAYRACVYMYYTKHARKSNCGSQYMAVYKCMQNMR
jgi:hypothetical protein